MEKEHEHNFIERVSDNGTIIIACGVCGGIDGDTFWKMCNDKWDFRFDTGKWIKNKVKKLLNKE